MFIEKVQLISCNVISVNQIDPMCQTGPPGGTDMAHQPYDTQDLRCLKVSELQDCLGMIV